MASFVTDESTLSNVRVALTADMFEGLCFLHELSISHQNTFLQCSHTSRRGFIHRDIKPENIIVDALGRAVIGDMDVSVALLADQVCIL